MGEKGKNIVNMAELRNTLLELILDKCFRMGDFTLASGKKSDFYIDGRIATLHPEGAYYIGRLFLDRCIETKADSVGGLTLGADPMVGAVVALSYLSRRPIRGFIVRKKQKEHGTARKVEGDLRKGDTVIVVEDVVTTGTSAMQAVESAREAGANVEAVMALVDREEGGEEVFTKEGLIFIPIFKATELKQAAREREKSK